MPWCFVMSVARAAHLRSQQREILSARFIGLRRLNRSAEAWRVLVRRDLHQ